MQNAFIIWALSRDVPVNVHYQQASATPPPERWAPQVSPQVPEHQESNEKQQDHRSREREDGNHQDLRACGRKDSGNYTRKDPWKDNKSSFHKIPGAYDNFSKRKRRDLLRYLFLRERQMSYVNTCICNLKKKNKIQWWSGRLHLPIQGLWVWSLVRELRSHMPRGQKTKT